MRSRKVISPVTDINLTSSLIFKPGVSMGIFDLIKFSFFLICTKMIVWELKISIW